MGKTEVNLRSIFEVDDDMLYDIVVYDRYLLEMKQKLVGFKELSDYTSPEYKTDFAVSNGVLQCNPLIVPARIDFKLKQTLMRENTDRTGMPASESLFYLLAKGVHDGNVIVGNSEEGRCEVTKFSNIRFSNSTMTAYAPIYGKDGMYNKVLVRYGKDDGLRVQPFIFGAHQSSMPGCKNVGEKEINGEHYFLLEPQLLSIYDDNVIFSEGIVNQACNNIPVFISAIAAVAKFIGMLTEYSDVQWAGGDGSYKSPYGVYFGPTVKKLKDTDLNFVLRWMLDNVMSGRLANDGIREKVGASFNASYAMAISSLKMIMESGNSPERQLATAFELKSVLQEKLFWNSLYCYRVRVDSFLYNKRLTPFDRPILTGGRTKEYTTVKALYIY